MGKKSDSSWKMKMIAHSLTHSIPTPRMNERVMIKTDFCFVFSPHTHIFTHSYATSYARLFAEWMAPSHIRGSFGCWCVCVGGGGRWEQKQENYIRDMQMTLTSKRDYAAHRGYCTRTQTKQHTADHRRNEKSVGEIKMNSAMFRVIKIWGWQLPRNESVSPFVLYAIYVHFHM